MEVIERMNDEGKGRKEGKREGRKEEIRKSGKEASNQATKKKKKKKREKKKGRERKRTRENISQFIRRKSDLDIFVEEGYKLKRLKKEKLFSFTFRNNLLTCFEQRTVALNLLFFFFWYCEIRTWTV